ncbi:unnamed protein product [Rhodiola kirilowii]
MAEAHHLITNPERADDRKIPVFTVLKNNTILKNIFLLQAPPAMNNFGGDIQSSGNSSNSLEERDRDAILTVGRHPNCSIVLSHPSISRFHLQIRSKPSVGKLSVTDLSSVHGTWVFGKRIKPRDSVELKEGDELRMGGSSRVYKLHWVSACQAYDLDHPFFPASDVNMCEDIEKQEEEAVFQDETGLQANDDMRLNSEANTELVSCEDEIPLQRSVRNDTALKGILKHRKESSPCIINPLSFPLPDEEILAATVVGEVDVENQANFAPVFSEMSIERSQMVECDDRVSLVRNLSEAHEEMKQLCSLPESCIEESTIKVDDCSQILEVPINGVGRLANEESPTTMSEKQLHQAEDQTKMPADNAEGFLGTTDDEQGSIEIGKGISQSVIESQTPMLELSKRQLFITENEERFDAMLVDICEHSDVENETPKYPIDAKQTINGQNSDGSQLSYFEKELVSDLTFVLHESDVKPVDKSQQSEKESRPLKLMVNSEVRSERLREEDIVTNSGDGVLVADSGIQILEPLLDSFVFTEKDAKESCDFKSGQSDFKSQSPETPFYMKCITHNGNRKGSKTVSNQSSNKSTASSQRCQSLGALKTLNCSSKEKRRGSSTAARTLHYSNAHGKSVLKPLLANLDGEEDTYEIYTPDKENFTPNTRLLKSMKKMDILDDVEVNSSRSYTSLNVSSTPSQSQKATSKALLADLGSAESEVEIYTPDKENFTPNTLLLKSMKRMGLLDENKINSSVSDNSRSTKISGSPYLVEQKYCNASEKENETPLIDQEQTSPTVIDHTGNKKKLLSVHRKAERIPLQSLSNNSSFRSKSDASINKVAIKSRGSVTRAKFQRKISPIKNNIALEAKVKWYMIVDSTCFVDSESRKALQLLQGLRGTKLIVPGTVLREFDAMNQHASLFRGTTKASAALQWLEDCLVNTKWWIHVQSFFEEVRHLAPTPPASPKLHNSYIQTGIKSWKTLPIFRSFSEVPSPKAEEDHILEYALQQMRSINDNERIVILSNDTSLRIKAMAEGLICETATEFRDTLVNPFSERFLWSESSPRGRTWSCQDDIVLREQFYSHGSKNSSKRDDTVKGLKLIMAYNSRDKNTSSSMQWK